MAPGSVVSLFTALTKCATAEGRRVQRAPVVAPVRSAYRPKERAATSATPPLAGLLWAALLGLGATACGPIELDGSVPPYGPGDARDGDVSDTGGTDQNDAGGFGDTADTKFSDDVPNPNALPDIITFGEPVSINLNELRCSPNQLLVDLDLYKANDGTQQVYGLCSTTDGRHTTLVSFQPDRLDAAIAVLDEALPTKSGLAPAPRLMTSYDMSHLQWFASAQLLGADNVASHAGWASLDQTATPLIQSIALPWTTADGTIDPQINSQTDVLPTNVLGIAANTDFVVLAATNTISRCAWNTTVTESACENANTPGMLYAVHVTGAPGAAENMRAIPTAHHGPSSVALIDIVPPQGAIYTRFAVVSRGADTQFPAPDNALAHGSCEVFDGQTVNRIHEHPAVLPTGAGFAGELGVSGQRIAFGDRAGGVYLINTDTAPAPDNTPDTADTVPGASKAAYARYPLPNATDHAITGVEFTADGKFAIAYDPTTRVATALRTNGSQFATVQNSTDLLPPVATSKALPTATDNTGAIEGLLIYTSAAHTQYVLINRGDHAVYMTINAVNP